MDAYLRLSALLSISLLLFFFIITLLLYALFHYCTHFTCTVQQERPQRSVFCINCYVRFPSFILHFRLKCIVIDPHNPYQTVLNTLPLIWWRLIKKEKESNALYIYEMRLLTVQIQWNPWPKYMIYVVLGLCLVFWINRTDLVD